MNKKSLTERDICTKFITPNLVAAGWDVDTQVREEVGFTDGRIYVRGKLHTRGAQKRADYILYLKPNIPIAVIEAKDNNHSVSAGIQQALGYAKTLDIPFVFSSNGDGFHFHDRTQTSAAIESELALSAFPSPDQLWQKYKAYKGLTEEIESIVAQDYFSDGSTRSPRYYQQTAINRTVEAVARNDGNNRHLLVMATGTGKTYTAFQIIYRLWKSGLKKRVLFLADRTSLVDQTVRGDFRHFKEAMTVIKHKNIDTAYNIYLALYQGLSDNNNEDAYKQFSPEFFDLIVVDECHRGSAREDSKWREILEYFKGATHIGMTATPKEGVVLNHEEKRFLAFIDSLEPSSDDSNSPYSVTVNIDIKFTRSKAKEALGIQVTNNPNAPEVRLTEEQVRDKYPWDYDRLTNECRARYPDFKIVKKYHELRKKLLKDKRFGTIRFLDPDNIKSSKKPFFNPNILAEFDKSYVKMG